MAGGEDRGVPDRGCGRVVGEPDLELPSGQIASASEDPTAERTARGAQVVGEVEPLAEVGAETKLASMRAYRTTPSAMRMVGEL